MDEYTFTDMAEGVYVCLTILAEKTGLDTSVFYDPGYKSDVIEYLKRMFTDMHTEAEDSPTHPYTMFSTTRTHYKPSLN